MQANINTSGRMDHKMKSRICSANLSLLLLMAFTIFVNSCSDELAVEPIVTDEPETDVEGPVELQPIAEAPAFQGKNLVDGMNISQADVEGHVYIVNFWATWCPPCEKEIPDFIQLQNEYGDRKFTVIGISVDQEGEAVVNDFIKEKGMNYPVIMLTEQIQSDYEDAMDAPLHSIPTSIVVNRDGDIVSVHVGFRTKEQFEQEIKELL